MSIKVVTDSTSDLPAAIVEEYGISVIPCFVNMGDESYLDGVELSREEFYRRLPDYDPPPTTSAPGIGLLWPGWIRPGCPRPGPGRN